jgi:hypothetical protein
MTGCDCWTRSGALGHGGHCCFLRDDRANLNRDDAWKPIEDICHSEGKRDA